MHALEKILARASGKSAVHTGETIMASVDTAEVNDLYLQVLVSFRQMGVPKVWDPTRIAFVLDHYAPAPTARSAANQREMRLFVWEQGIEHLFDTNAGVCHQVLAEAGLVWPGALVVETDSHTTTMGAFGCFGTGCGATDMAAIMATGKIWLRVPEVVKIDYAGSLPHGVTGKDVALKTLREYGTEVGNYKALEFVGKAIEDMTLSQKMALCNMAVEMGAKTSYIQPTQDVLDYVEGRTGKKPEPVFTDPGYEYSEVLSVSLDGLEPQVACPSRVDNVKSVSEVAGEAIDQATIGTCTGGRFEDLEVAASILRGHKINPRVRLQIIPASNEVLKHAIKAGIMEVFIDAGATIVTPGCGPCLGAHQGVLAAGEKCVTASSRNFPGRMGSTEAGIFVASPATVAASAVEGKIADPRKYL